MQKIYVLLRHDKQTGPYSLPELIQFDLKPYDLIWIEGQSAGWYYPQEIGALHPYLSFIPAKPLAASQAPPVEKKLAIHRPVSAPPPLPDPLPEIVETTPVKTYQPVAPAPGKLEEAVFAQFRTPVAEKEPARVNPALPKPAKSPKPVVVALTTVLIVGSVFTASWILNRQSPEKETVTQPVAEIPAQSEITPPAVATDDNTKKKQTTVYKEPKQKKNSNLTAQATAVIKPVAQQTTAEQPRTSSPADEATGYEMTGSTTPGEEVQQNAPSATAEETTTAPEEKKKTIRDRFRDLFRKKPQENKEQEKRSTETETTERVATRREGAANLAHLVHVRFDVPNDWMMGIKAAKATMINRSTEDIRTATVEVLYYNDDNELLQKREVTFGKIEAKESAIIAIPDHATATKVDYRVLSVTGASKPAA